MAVPADLSTVFRPGEGSLSDEAKVKVQVHRVLSFFGALMIPLFGILHDIPVWGAVDSVLSRLGLSAFFLGLIVASYVSSHIRQTFSGWLHAGLYGTLAWTVVVAAQSNFGPDYTVGLVVVYATFIAITGFGAETITPVLWFAGVGLLFAVGGIALGSPLRTSPQVLLAYMAVVAAAETVTIAGSLSSARSLREREEQLKSAQRLARLGYWSYDVQNESIRVSQETRRIFGWAQSIDVTPETFLEMVHPADRERVRTAHEDLLAGDAVLDLEFRIRNRLGQERVVHERGVRYRDESGETTSVMGALLDITEQKETERALRRSEQRFRGVFEESALGIALLNEDGRLLEANEALESMLRFEPGRLQGRHFEEFTHPDDANKDKALYAELVQGERDAYALEKRYIRTDGQIVWGYLTVSSREGPDGIQVIGMVQDISAEKEQKEQLRLFQKIVEQAHEAVVILEEGCSFEEAPVIAYVNPAFTEMTGYDEEEAIGRPATFLQGAETEPWVLERWRKRLKDESVFEGEAVNYRKDGSRFVNRWSTAPVRDEEGIVTHWVSVQRDVTEQREIGKRLLEVQEEERRRIDREMHDQMGGLLTALQLTLDRARISATDGAEVSIWLDQVVDLVDELAGVTRTISRRLHPGNLDDHGLGPALSALADQMEVRHDLTVDLDVGTEPEKRYSPLVEMTAYRVVQEALVNVVAHAHANSARVVVWEEDEHLRLHVMDRGVGFDSTAQKREDTFGIQGMAKRVERLNGELHVESTVGEGTRISATLPLAVGYVPD